jgi:hypothetical protein
VARRGDAPSRGEVTEKVDEQRDTMRETEETLETYVGDIETIRQTLESLEGGGTTEGADSVEEHIQEADNVTTDAFDREDEGLERTHEESQEYGGELQERSDSAESDRQQISDAESALKTDDAVGGLREALDAAHEDVEFLKEHFERNREDREESERIQQELQSRAHSG